MTRTWIALAVVLSLHASVVGAQSTHFTVSTASASVYKAPTNISPVLGQAAPGATFEVARDVGSWVKIAWPKSPDGVGYIRKTAGTMSVLGPAVPATPVTTSAAVSKPIPSAAPHTAASAQVGPGVRSQPSAVPAGYVAMPSHRLGLGAQIGGSAVGAGVSARAWTSGQRLGYQFDVSRYSMSNDVFFTRMTSTQVGPRVLYAFRDHVSDSTWVRPYLGLGAHVLRSSMTDPVTGGALSNTGMAAQLFGGGEMTLSAVPRLGVSADVGYQWYKNPFPGYALNGMTLTVSAHWYLR